MSTGSTVGSPCSSPTHSHKLGLRHARTGRLRPEAIQEHVPREPDRRCPRPPPRSVFPSPHPEPGPAHGPMSCIGARNACTMSTTRRPYEPIMCALRVTKLHAVRTAPESFVRGPTGEAVPAQVAVKLLSLPSRYARHHTRRQEIFSRTHAPWQCMSCSSVPHVPHLLDFPLGRPLANEQPAGTFVHCVWLRRASAGSGRQEQLRRFRHRRAGVAAAVPQGPAAQRRCA